MTPTDFGISEFARAYMIGQAEGAMVLADGVIPFADPFVGRYDIEQNGLLYSKLIGVGLREISIGIASTGFAQAVWKSSQASYAVYQSKGVFTQYIMRRGVLAGALSPQTGIKVIDQTAQALIFSGSIIQTGDSIQTSVEYWNLVSEDLGFDD